MEPAQSRLRRSALGRSLCPRLVVLLLVGLGRRRRDADRVRAGHALLQGLVQFPLSVVLGLLAPQLPPDIGVAATLLGCGMRHVLSPAGGYRLEITFAGAGRFLR